MPSPSKLALATVTLSGAMILGACPGQIDDPERFTGGGCPDVPGELFPQTCGTASCHDAMTAAGDLDLVSPGVEDRVAGVISGSADCSGEVLADPEDPSSSLLVRKLRPSPPCGVQMPQFAEPLTEAEIVCVESWIGTLDGGGSGGSGTGGASTGGSGGS